MRDEMFDDNACLEPCCRDCGQSVDEELEEGFAISEDVVLCWSCGIRRGASYDAALRRWTDVLDSRNL